MVAVLRSLGLLLALAAGLQAKLVTGDHVLRGFTLVDPATMSAVQRDLYVVAGKLTYHAPPGAEKLPMVEGQGRWLLPGLQDLRLGPWGNSSSQFYEKIFQQMGPDTLLEAQLYCGVTRVVFGYGGFNLAQGLKRIQLMEMPAAEGLESAKILRGFSKEATGARQVVTRTADAAPTMKAEWKEGLAYAQVSYGDVLLPWWPAVSEEVLREAVRSALALKAPVWVLADTWPRMRVAVEAGASVVEGLPDGKVDLALLKTMAAKGVYFAPALTWLELPGMNGQVPLVDDGFGPQLIQKNVRDSFHDLKNYEARLAPQMALTPASRAARLEGLRQAAKAGVKLLMATNSAWVAGAFQGVSVHRSLRMMAEAGVEPWQRLRSATQWPSQFLGRLGGLTEGSPADLLVLTADPLKDPEASDKIAAVCRAGRWVEREKLLPDLSRSHYPR